MVNHGNFIAANAAKLFIAHGGKVLAFELYLPAHNAAVDTEILHHAQGNRGFATTGFADQPNSFTRLHINRKIHHCGNFSQTGKE